MKDSVRKYVLKNAYNFNGKVNDKVVLGLVLKERPELKKDVPAVLREIQTVSKEVETLSQQQLKKELKKLAPELLKEQKKKKKEKLNPLPGGEKGKEVGRGAPSPRGL